MSTSPSSAASAAIASPSRTSSTRPSTRAIAGPSATAAAAACDAVGVAAGEQDAVLRRHAGGQPLDERAAEPLVGACDKCDT